MSDTDKAIIESSTDQIWPRDPTPARPVVEYPLPDARVARCKSCGAAIVWTISPRGAHLPLSLATARDTESGRVAQSHYTDCPQAPGWSKKGGR